MNEYWFEMRNLYKKFVKDAKEIVEKYAEAVDDGRKRGHWKLGVEGGYFCSECGYVSWRKANYCHHCGSYNKEGGEDK